MAPALLPWTTRASLIAGRGDHVQTKLCAHHSDFGGIDKDGAPIGFLWSNSLVFHGDDVLVTNLSLDVAALTSQSLRTVDGPWAGQVKLHTVSTIKKRIPSVPQ